MLFCCLYAADEVQFQGGGYQPWGGAGFESCAALLNHEFQRVLFKNNYAAGIAIFNVYMVSADLFPLSCILPPSPFFWVFRPR